MMRRSRLVLVTVAVAVAFLTPLLVIQLGLWQAITPREPEPDGDANVPPRARFTLRPESPRALEAVLFDARDSSDQDGGVELFTWDFGEGTILSSNQPMVVHFFHALGDLTVSLVVTDDQGTNGSTSKVVTVWWDRSSIRREEMSISLDLPDPGPYSIWVPILVGSPFEEPAVWRKEGVEVSLVEDSGRTFLNITSSNRTAHAVVLEFEESVEIDYSFMEYAWSTRQARAFSNESMNMVIHWSAISGLPPPWQVHGYWGGCIREETLTAVLTGDGSWTRTIQVQNDTLCS